MSIPRKSVCFLSSRPNEALSDSILFSELRKLDIAPKLASVALDSQYDLIIPTDDSWYLNNLSNALPPKVHEKTMTKITKKIGNYCQLIGTFDVTFIANKFSHVTRKGYGST